MSCVGAAPRAAVPVSNARAEASRRNGARSRGPKTAEGKARASRNALKHGLRAGRHVLLRDEDSSEFEALEVALFEELAPQGALQGFLVGRIARAAWRLARAERIEINLFAERLELYPDAGPGLALIRDGNTGRAFETLVRYRSTANNEFLRNLRALKTLQAEAAAAEAQAAAGPSAPARPDPDKRAATAPDDRPAAHDERPNDPEARGNLRQSDRAAEPAHPGAAPRSSNPAPAALLPRPASTPDVRPVVHDRMPNEPGPHVPFRFGGTLNGRRVPAAGLG
jgi:hypothetical protein